MPDRAMISEPDWAPAWAPEDGRERAAALFRASYGKEPGRVLSAPGRVTIIGEHTDYNQGMSMAASLRHRTYVAVGTRDDDLVRATTGAAGVSGPDGTWSSRLDDIGPGRADGWPAHFAGVVWAMRERGYQGQGVDLAAESCVPVGSGLSSSAALHCATALALDWAWGLALGGETGKGELAEACVDAENDVVGAPTGGLDHYTALFCGAEEALMLDFSTKPPLRQPMPLYFTEYGLDLLVIDTGVPHEIRDGRYAERTRQCQDAAAALGVPHLRALADRAGALAAIEALEDPLLRNRARHVVTEIERVRRMAAELSHTGPAHERFTEAGRLLSASHRSLAGDFEVSSPELDAAVDATEQAGSLGSRMVGGGFGGAAIALVRKTRLEQTVRAVQERFTDEGYAPPRFLAL